MRGNQRSCRWRGARLRNSTETFQICTSLSDRPESPRAISSAMMAKVWVSVPFSSSTPPNSSGTPRVRMPTFCAPSRISGGSRPSGRMSHSRCQLPRIKGITTSSTKSRQLWRIMRCSSDNSTMLPPSVCGFAAHSSRCYTMDRRGREPPADECPKRESDCLNQATAKVTAPSQSVSAGFAALRSCVSSSRRTRSAYIPGSTQRP